MATSKTSFNIGETDIILLTRKLGVLIIEVKGITKIRRKDWTSMEQKFSTQAHRSMDATKRLVKVLCSGLPYEDDKKKEAEEGCKYLQKLPGLVALPNVSKSILDHQKEDLGSNILFKEDFSTPEDLKMALKPILGHRAKFPLTWDRQTQDFIIAGEHHNH